MKRFKARTSISHPLQIAEVATNAGLIGITFCPGKHDHFAVNGAWERDLHLDLDVIQHWGAQLVLTLVEHQEMKELGVSQLGLEVEQRDIDWVHLPIANHSTPSERFEADWLEEGYRLRQRLRNGERVLIHCKGGRGRAGMIAARLLVELGANPDCAIEQVRSARTGAIETPSQLALVHRTRPMIDTISA